MQDDLGLYYYPDPNDKRTRVYVRSQGGSVEFRLWRADRPEVWERHEWVPLEVIRHAAGMYRDMGREADPLKLYDEAVARALLKAN
ncbi:hypothetical protein ACR4XJ_10105 [Nitratidesulfovibrio sp. D1]|jgi:hypothetical protein|uniref:hypothetical protein n=1 Tax=unclassified Nitratidesulfovibrio TaxID=2802296 RepID=UPI002FD92BB5